MSELTTIRVAGKAFHCDCGANVFRKDKDVYVCNACGSKYVEICAEVTPQQEAQPLSTERMLEQFEHLPEDSPSRPTADDLAKRLKQTQKDLAQALEFLGEFHTNNELIWRELQRLSPWGESNDMDWIDEIMCGFGGVETRLTEMQAALEACRVFVTPLERLKNWNEFKEDAAKRLAAVLPPA